MENPNRSIILGGQVLHGDDRYGEWGVQTVEAWKDAPPGRGEVQENPNGDGESDLPVYYGARYPTFGGYLIANSESLMFEAMNRLTALLTAPARLVVAGYGPTQWAMVTRPPGQVPVSNDPVTDTFLRWQIRMKCADPKKYGRTRDFVRSAGSVTVSHRGNYNALPTVVVRGSAPGGYRINGPGSLQYKVTRALESGKPHRIEFRDGGLRVDGTLVYSGVTSADVWPVPPGAGTAFDINVNSGGTAEATITITDTYI